MPISHATPGIRSAPTLLLIAFGTRLGGRWALALMMVGYALYRITHHQVKAVQETKAERLRRRAARVKQKVLRSVRLSVFSVRRCDPR